MADIKWIKITTDIFDDEKILLIESMPDADATIVIWFKLLAFAGKSNNNGVFMMSEKIAYTDEMLATIFRRPLNTVRMALQTFETFGMIENIDGVIRISNWDKHQNVAGMEKIREQNRKRVAEHRARQKALSAPTSDAEASQDDVIDSNVTVTLHNATDKDKIRLREDKEKIRLDGDKEEIREETNYRLIGDMYNEICISFPRLRAMSEARKKAIKARVKSGYTIDDFRTLFEMAEASTFLKGGNDRNWSATFDWLLKDSNMAKVLDGNYADRVQVQTPIQVQTKKRNSSDELLEMIRTGAFE